MYSYRSLAKTRNAANNFVYGNIPRQLFHSYSCPMLFPMRRMRPSVVLFDELFDKNTFCWNPFPRQMASAAEELTDTFGLFSDFNGKSSKRFYWAKYRGNDSRSNIFHERENEYEITLDLPGMKKTDINVSIEDGIIRIFGKRILENAVAGDKCPTNNKSVDSSAEGKIVGDEGNELENERFHRKIFHSFSLPNDIIEDNSKIVAKYENGVLSVQIPKQTNEKVQKQTTIEIQ